jgi:hypothetical protein
VVHMAVLDDALNELDERLRTLLTSPGEGGS